MCQKRGLAETSLAEMSAMLRSVEENADKEADSVSFCQTFEG